MANLKTKLVPTIVQAPTLLSAYCLLVNQPLVDKARPEKEVKPFSGEGQIKWSKIALHLSAAKSFVQKYCYRVDTRIGGLGRD